MFTIVKKAAVLSVSTIAMVQGSALAGNGHVPALPSAIPSNPNAGECYARVQVPAQYETRSQQVMVHDGYTDYQVEQPHISTRAQEVLVKEPSVQYRVRQPQYTTVTEQMMVRPAYEKLQVSPPQFDTITETMQVTGPRLIWKKGNPATLRSQGYVVHSTADGGPGGQGYSSTMQYGAAQTSNAMHCGDTCEIWCLVEEPGQSVSFNRRVLKQPAMVHRVPVAAKYQSITKQVLADPGGVEEIPVPAEYATVMVEDVMPARASGAVNVPPQYSDVAVNVPVQDERWEWRRVVCETGTYLEPNTSSQMYSGGYSSGTYSSGSSHSSGTTYSSGGTYHSGTTYSSGPSYSTGTATHSGGHAPSGYSTSGTTTYGGHSGNVYSYEGSQHSGHSSGYTSGQTGGNYSYDQNSGTFYDKASGYYHDGKAAVDAYEGVKREKKRWRR